MIFVFFGRGESINQHTGCIFRRIFFYVKFFFYISRQLFMGGLVVWFLSKGLR